MKRKRNETEPATENSPGPLLVNGIGKNKNKRAKKLSKGKKKKDKLAKGPRVPQAHEYYVVPWCDSSDWDEVCTNFNKGNYDAVIQELTMWRERVPALPIGAESTLCLLQAIVYDTNQNQNLRSSKSSISPGAVDDQCRSLYSLAVVRYLNHISHLATKEMGENAPFQMIQLATHLNVPDWIVELRHVVSHGSTLPSLEVLRLAADFIKNWLQNNYWIDLDNDPVNPGPESSSSGVAEVLKTKKKNPKVPENPPLSKEEKYLQMTRAISSYLACRIYKLRSVKLISDPEITQHLPNQPWKVTPKLALGLLKTQLANWFTTDPFLLCTAFAFEIVPSDEFLMNFSALLELPVPAVGKLLESDNVMEVFEKLCELWKPLIDLISMRSKVPQMCSLLTNIYMSENSTKNSKLFSALWLDHFLEILEEDEKKYPSRLKKIVATVLSAPDPVGKIFFPRLLQLLENNLGPTRIHQLETLFNIWVDDGVHPSENIVRKGVAQKSPSVGSSKLFTIDHLIPNSTLNEGPAPRFHLDLSLKENNTGETSSAANSLMKQGKCISNWQIDIYGDNYWRNIPLGGSA